MRIPQESLAIYSNNPKDSGRKRQKLLSLFSEIFELLIELLRPGRQWEPSERPEQSSMRMAWQERRPQGTSAIHLPLRVTGCASN